MLKFKVGQVWKDRSGELLEIVSVTNTTGFRADHPVLAVQKTGGNKNGEFMFTEKGKFLNDKDVMPYDLIELVSDPSDFEEVKPEPARLTLEVGKTYVTADGTPVKIVSEDCDETYPMNGSNAMCYMRNGKEWNTGPTDGDLIEELPEPRGAAPAGDQPAEDRGFFLDQLMFELIRANPGAASQWLCGTFLALADARSQA